MNDQDDNVEIPPCYIASSNIDIVDDIDDNSF